MITGKTTSGFEFAISEDSLDDYELLEDLCKIDLGEHGLVPNMVERLLGKEQKEALKAHVKKVVGRVSTKALLNEVAEIFQGCTPGKNS